MSPRAEVEDPVGEPQIRNERFGALEDLGMNRRRLVRCGVGHELDLVELVDPQQTSGVLAGGTGLAAEAGCVGHQPHRQVSGVEDLVPGEGGERDLGGRNRPRDRRARY